MGLFSGFFEPKHTKNEDFIKEFNDIITRFNNDTLGRFEKTTMIQTLKIMTAGCGWISFSGRLKYPIVIIKSHPDDLEIIIDPKNSESTLVKKSLSILIKRNDIQPNNNGKFKILKSDKSCEIEF